MLCVVGATIGRLGVAPSSWAGANIARAVARIAPIAEVNRDYLLLVLRSPIIQSYFATTTRTLAQPTLNVGAIEQTPIPIPPLAELTDCQNQKSFANAEEIEMAIPAGLGASWTGQTPLQRAMR